VTLQCVVRVPFQVACNQFEAKQYDAVLPYLDKQIALGSANGYLKETLLLRAKFRVLAGLPEKAETDINKLMGINGLPPRVGVTSSVCSSLGTSFEIILSL